MPYQLVKDMKEKVLASRPPKGTKSHHGGLNEETITVAALALLDEEGLAKFSLRNLATALGVFPSAIYWYLPSKDDVAAAVISHVLKDVVPVLPRKSWQAYLRALFVNCRDAVRAHPNTAPLLGAQLTANTRVDFHLIEGVLEALSHAGFHGDALVNAYNATIATMVGFATQEFSPMPESGSDWQSHARERLQSVAPDAFPLLSQNLANLRNRSFILRWDNGIGSPLDSSFDFYIEAFIAGLAQLSGKHDVK
jgi:AcrR family transcriptional regulator